MSELLNQIQAVQMEAAEAVVVDDLRRKGLLPPKQAIVVNLDELQRLIDQYCAEKAVDSTDGLRRLFLKGFVEWVRDRETTNGSGVSKGE